MTRNKNREVKIFSSSQLFVLECVLQDLTGNLVVKPEENVVVHRVISLEEFA